ncbi:MAG: hypothetical protein ABJA74_17145 [Lapillicoccus sp.]
MADRRVLALVAVAAAGLLAVGGYVALRSGVGPLADPERCTATVGGHSVALSIDQAQNASIIAAVAERRRLPARAVAIALATAFQESKLVNLDSGDRDSRGLFQQRPSQGWGTPEQVMDPYYAANAFYDALVKVAGYQTMAITDAAQAVQHSAYPAAYGDNEADGRAIASAMAGFSKAAFTCVVKRPTLTAQQRQPNGLTPRADAVRQGLRHAFGDVHGVGPGGGTTGRGTGAQERGRALEVLFAPASADNTRRGWAVASYLVANAKRLHIARIVFDARIWTAGDRSADGWRTLTPTGLTGGESAATLAHLEHRDHVRVVVS